MLYALQAGKERWLYCISIVTEVRVCHDQHRRHTIRSRKRGGKAYVQGRLRLDSG